VDPILGSWREATRRLRLSNYDKYGSNFDGLKRINTFWLEPFEKRFGSMCPMSYFKQKIKEVKSVSSAMPHKVHPIDFEKC